MNIRLGVESDFLQLAEMKWLHCEEDDVDYKEHNLDGVDKEKFISEFIDFFKVNKDYKIFIVDDGTKIMSAMFVYLIPKLPKPNGNAKYIAYLTNVYTRKEYRNKKIGTILLNYIKQYLTNIKCELIFAWPSDNSVKWYKKNAFYQENEIFQCDLVGE